ncbi:unnamed protein product [Prorocentrum cordatum]|uniref:START domain-containing protein n=1 Tax=Prorocentrum cordatum TaxID=2364126 RepID=A0ABN9S8U6_9DINO|nr:unnamed protein product [Polarella glacialis]
MVPGGPLPERDLSRPISAEELGAFKAWAGAPPPDGWELETDEAHVKAYRHVEYFGTDNSKVAEYVRCECEVEAAAATTLALIREPDRRRAWDDIVGESLRVTQVRGHEFVSFSHDGLLGVGARSFLLWYGLQSFDEAGRECGPDSTAQTHVMMWCPAAVDWPGLPEPPEGAKRTKALAFAMVLVQDGERRRTRLTFAARACFPAGLLEYVVPSIMRDIMPKYVTRLQCAAAAAPEAEADRVAGPPQQQPSRRVQLHGPTRGPEVPRERPRQPPQAPQLPAPQQQAAPLPTGLGLAYIPPSRKSALAAEHLPDALSEDEGDVWGSSGAYECEFDCGFRGSFGEVAAHEGRCWRRRELTALARPEVARAARAELPGRGLGSYPRGPGRGEGPEVPPPPDATGLPSRPRRSRGELLKSAEVPEHQKQPYILCGYRQAPAGPCGLLATMFMLHNETVNMWTHLFGSLYAVGMGVHLVSTLDYDDHGAIEAEARWVLALVFTTAVCLLASFAYHLCNCTDQRVCQCMHKMDQTGIVCLIIMSYFSGISLFYRCFPRLRLFYLCFAGCVAAGESTPAAAAGSSEEKKLNTQMKKRVANLAEARAHPAWVEPPALSVDREAHRTHMKSAMQALEQQIQAQEAITTVPSPMLEAKRQEFAVFQFLHLYAFLPKERVSNQTNFLSRVTRRFEEAQEAERAAEIALTTAQRAREALATEVTQAQELLTTFEELAREEIKTVTFEESPHMTATQAASPPSMPPSGQAAPQVIAELRAGQVTLTSSLSALQHTMVSLQQSLSQLVIQQQSSPSPSVAPPSGPAQPATPSAATMVPVSHIGNGGVIRPITGKVSQARNLPEKAARQPGQQKLRLPSKPSGPQDGQIEEEMGGEPPHKSQCLAFDAEEEMDTPRMQDAHEAEGDVLETSFEDSFGNMAFLGFEGDYVGAEALQWLWLRFEPLRIQQQYPPTGDECMPAFVETATDKADSEHAGVELVSLLDASGRIGSSLSRFVGPIAAEAQNLPGRCTLEDMHWVLLGFSGQSGFKACWNYSVRMVGLCLAARVIALEVANRWLQHFSNEEAAPVIPESDLLWFLASHPTLDASVTHNVDINIEDVPSFAVTQHTFSRAKASAAGPGGIPGAVLKQLAILLGSYFHLLYVKSTAFYKSVRELVFRASASDEAVAALLKFCGLPAEATHELAEYVKHSIPILEQCRVSALRRGLFSDSYEQSWFYIRDGGGVAFPSMGSGPGQQLGDVVFNFTDPAIPNDKIDQYLQLFSDEPPPEDPSLEVPLYVCNPGEFSGISTTSVPIRIRRPTLCALSLYCGRRRQGDVQWHVECTCTQPPIELIVLSVDFAIDAAQQSFEPAPDFAGVNKRSRPKAQHESFRFHDSDSDEAEETAAEVVRPTSDPVLPPSEFPEDAEAEQKIEQDQAHTRAQLNAWYSMLS